MKLTGEFHRELLAAAIPLALDGDATIPIRNAAAFGIEELGKSCSSTASASACSRSALRRSGYEVLTATAGDEGLQLLLDRPEIELLVLDANMPGLSGRQLLGKMQELGITTPAILASGYCKDEAPTLEEFRNLRGFLSKPFSIRELVRLAGEVLGRV